MQWNWYVRIYSDGTYTAVYELYLNDGVEETEIFPNQERLFMPIPYEFTEYPFEV